MKKCMYIILALCAVAAATNTRGARDLEAQKNDLPAERGLLLLGGSSCPLRESAIVFFNVETKIHSADAKCRHRKLDRIGDMINDQLREVGIGDVVTELKNTTFLAGVCTDPEKDFSTRNRRELWTPNWYISYVGGGVSSNCDVNPCSIFVRSILTQISVTGLPKLW